MRCVGTILFKQGIVSSASSRIVFSAAFSTGRLLGLDVVGRAPKQLEFLFPYLSSEAVAQCFDHIVVVVSKPWISVGEHGSQFCADG